MKNPKYQLVLKVLPVVILCVVIKVGLQLAGFQPLGVAALSSIVLGAVLFNGFLMNGVIADYKEAEKLPGDITVIVHHLLDQAVTAYVNTGAPIAAEAVRTVDRLDRTIRAWIYQSASFDDVLDAIDALGDVWVELEHEARDFSSYLMFQSKQSDLRAKLIRVNTIRATDFVPVAYGVSEVMIGFVAIVLILTKVGNAAVGCVSLTVLIFVLLGALLLIRDLDNPFDYSLDENEEVLSGAVEVSLHPFDDLTRRMKSAMETIENPPDADAVARYRKRYGPGASGDLATAQAQANAGRRNEGDEEVKQVAGTQEHPRFEDHSAGQPPPHHEY